MQIEDPHRLFVDYLRARGRNVTEARTRIVQEVFRIHHHFHAADLWVRLREDTSISISTIYRTLDLLVDSGLVRKVELGNQGGSYEHILGHGHHYHLVCKACGKVIEFSDPDLERNLRQAINRHGFKQKAYDLKVLGQCEECRKGEREFAQKYQRKN